MTVIKETGELKVCRVCELLDNDKTLKLCRYCCLCKNWICLDCIPDINRRARAGTKEFLLSLKKEKE